MMSIAEVYANNIMPHFIVSFLGVRKDDEESIDDCREGFLNFLLDKETKGMIYSSQVAAWEEYKKYVIIHQSPNEFEHLDKDKEEIEDMSWTEELELLAYFKANTIEFLGNYNYENMRKGSLPSQQ